MNKDGVEKFPASFQISRQLDQEKINFLTLRVEELVRSNNTLRTSSDQNEKDTHDIVLYFQREMEIKDDVILRLNEELVKCQTQLKFEVEKVRKAFEEELSDIRTNSEATISSLTIKLENAESELKSVYAFKQAKDQHEGTILQLERQMQSQREQLIDAMEEQERRFLEEKSQLFRDLDEQKAAFREVALQDARSAMGEEAKKILADNNRMFEELKFHHSEAADFQAEKNVLQSELTTAKREIAIYADKEGEYARQAHMRTKEIKALRERVEQLEKQQTENIDRFKMRAKELKNSVTKELQEATLDAAGLRRLIQIKNKELRQMKSLAATILSQRTEVEQFFLEALQEVKDVIKKERRVNLVDSKKTLNKLRSGAGGKLSQSFPARLDPMEAGAAGAAGGKSAREAPGAGMFPPLNVKGSQLQYLEQKPASKLPNKDLSKVTIKDLSWDDKELVLRVLFSKMNGMQGNVNKGVQNVARRTQAPMPQPVFVSEGAYMPDAADAANYQGNFEIDRPGSSGSGYGDPADLMGDRVYSRDQEGGDSYDDGDAGDGSYDDDDDEGDDEEDDGIGFGGADDDEGDVDVDDNFIDALGADGVASGKFSKQSSAKLGKAMAAVLNAATEISDEGAVATTES